MALIGWIVLGAIYYLFIPIFHTIWLFTWLAIAVGWLWAGLWSFTAVMSYLSLKSYGRAAVGLVTAVTIGAILWTTDWPLAHVKSVLWLSQGSFADLAADYESGKPPAVPSWMQYLAVDGKVEAQPNGLYFPVFVDLWRSESGEGFAYLPGDANPRTLIQTAEGDIGGPTHDLGNGWWWIE